LSCTGRHSARAGNPLKDIKRNTSSAFLFISKLRLETIYYPCEDGGGWDILMETKSILTALIQNSSFRGHKNERKKFFYSHRDVIYSFCFIGYDGSRSCSNSSGSATSEGCRPSKSGQRKSQERN
jgi:hypothetical protein